MAFPQRPIAHLLGSNGPVHALVYSASPGTYILTGSADRSIRLYNPTPDRSQTLLHSSHITKSPTAPITQGRLIQTFSSHGYEVLSITVSSDNERFASAGGDRVVFLWDVSSATTLRRFGGNVYGHSSRINCVSFGGEGDSVIVSGGLDTTVRVWDVKSNATKPIQSLEESRDAVTALAVRGHEIVAGSVDGRVRGYDVRMGRCVTDVIGASVTSVCLTRDGRTMLVGSLDSKLRLMDRDDGSCLRSYSDDGWKNAELRVQSLMGGGERYVVAGDELASGAESSPDGEGRIWAWDLLTGKLVAKVAVPWGPEGYESKRRAVGRDGKARERKNIVSCMAWRENGWGDQFCVGGTSGAVTVFESP